MSLVLDASLAVSWYFADERTQSRLAVFRTVAEQGGVVPALFPLEVANVLQMAVVRGRVTRAFRDASLHDLSLIELEIDPETNDHAWADTLALAERHRLTVYDAAYLELALRRDLPLATLDAALAAAGKAEGLEALPI